LQTRAEDCFAYNVNRRKGSGKENPRNQVKKNLDGKRRKVRKKMPCVTFWVHFLSHSLNRFQRVVKSGGLTWDEFKALTEDEGASSRAPRVVNNGKKN